MTLNHALIMNPQLLIDARQTSAELQKQRALAYSMYRFTSLVSLQAEFILLEIGASISLFNGVNRLLNLISHELDELDTNFRLGLAYTPQAALLVSHYECDINDSSLLTNSRQIIRKAGIEHLNITTKIIRKLQACGFEYLDELIAIDRAELGVRFGAEFLLYLDRLFGRIVDIQTPIFPPQVFEACMDFAEPINNNTWITQQLERLLADLSKFIEKEQVICRGFVWRFFDDKNYLIETVIISLSTQKVKHSKPGMTLQHALVDSMLELTQLKLNTLTMKWSFSRIELSSNQLLPKQFFNDDLFDPRPDEEQFKQLLNKLVNRLGEQAVVQISPQLAHLPELKNVIELATEVGLIPTDYSVSKTPSKEFKDQPIWILTTPKIIQQHLFQPQYQGALQIIHGPDRVVSHWWANLQSRDYYIARQQSGRLLWLFFNRNQRTWYLHGLFA
jgi:protein ImuB